MDGEDLIICETRLVVQKLWSPLVSDGSGELHSIAKQASFSIAFWSNFGGFGRPKSMPKFDFGVFFFDVFFDIVFASIFN